MQRYIECGMAFSAFPAQCLLVAAPAVKVEAVIELAKATRGMNGSYALYLRIAGRKRKIEAVVLRETTCC